MNEPLTQVDFWNLHEVMSAVRQQQCIKFVSPDDCESMMTGYAISFCSSEDSLKPWEGEDIRDAFVRIAPFKSGNTKVSVQYLMNLVPYGGFFRVI